MLMAEQCCSVATPQERVARADHCPSCGQRGRAVALVTVQAQVAISLQALAAPSYWFCATRDCPVVYFAADAPAITRDQIRERVFQKEPLGDVLVCYCFRYPVGLLQQSDPDQCAAILAEIVAGTQHGRCACTIRNPQGSCCLGNVRGLLSRREPHDLVDTAEVR
jgi:hypothetical protein